MIDIDFNKKIGIMNEIVEVFNSDLKIDFIEIMNIFAYDYTFDDFTEPRIKFFILGNDFPSKDWFTKVLGEDVEFKYAETIIQTGCMIELDIRDLTKDNMVHNTRALRD